LSVGVELDVTPFINPDGLVVMDINQEIDDLDGFTVIDGVGDVPNTTKRTLNSEIAVKDKDTVMLGGFIRSDKSNSKTGVPFLQDIPIIGNLFTQRSDSKDRSETIVLIRPTVLRTPEIAAAQAITEQKRLPGISAAAEDAMDEGKQIEAEAKAEEAEAQAEAKAEAAAAKAAQNHSKSKVVDHNSFFLPVLPNGTVITNNVAPSNP
jgi:type II secretory pathway component GspD/PulD (secretin)